MKPIQIDDERGGSLMVLEDAGYYFSPNVAPETILNLQNFQARPSDTLVVTYPKSGTHWVYEIVSMLVNRSRTLTKEPIQNIEYLPSNVLDEMSSPRVMCSHLPYPRIPLDFLRKRSKIVLCVRNPRDVAVSYHKFISNLRVWHYDGSWDSFFPLFLNGSLPYNSWFEHTEAWLKVARVGKHNVHLVFYEDFHLDFERTVLSLAKFLGVDATEELLEDIHRETKFSNMKSRKVDITMDLSRNGSSPIYRTGRVGDWVSWFTPEQREQLDQEMESWGLLGDSRFKYTVQGETVLQSRH